MIASELREKTVAELNKEHIELLREQFNLRMQKTTKNSAKPHEVRRLRRNIARVLTVIKEKVGTEA